MVPSPKSPKGRYHCAGASSDHPTLRTSSAGPDQATVEGLWARIQDFLGAFPHGLYLSDIHLYDETFRLRMARAFAIALHGFARGAIHMHYPQAHQCVDALEQAGFADVRVDPPAAYGAPPASPDGTVFVRVISATA